MATQPHNIDTSDFTILGRVPVEPIPGLASRPTLRTSTYDAAEQAAAMNAVLVALNALLAEESAQAA